jgi:hypothetical protein
VKKGDETLSNKTYILDSAGQPLQEKDIQKWGAWFQVHTKERIVAETEKGKAKVLTIFLGLDHNFGQGEPILFETRIINGIHDGYNDRYTTRGAAEAGHKEAVRLAFGGAE